MFKCEWKKIQEESRGAEREKAEEGRGKKNSDSTELVAVASTVSCQMMIFQMLEVGEEKRGSEEKKFKSLFFFLLFLFVFL